jgi:hypothetical protein
VYRQGIQDHPSCFRFFPSEHAHLRIGQFPCSGKQVVTVSLEKKSQGHYWELGRLCKPKDIRPLIIFYMTSSTIVFPSSSCLETNGINSNETNTYIGDRLGKMIIQNYLNQGQQGKVSSLPECLEVQAKKIQVLHHHGHTYQNKMFLVI